MPYVTFEKALIHSTNFALCFFKNTVADPVQDKTTDFEVAFNEKE